MILGTATANKFVASPIVRVYLTIIIVVQWFVRKEI